MARKTASLEPKQINEQNSAHGITDNDNHHAAIEAQIALPLGEIAASIKSLADEISAERRNREPAENNYRKSQLNWQRGYVIAASLLSALTFGVLIKTCQKTSDLVGTAQTQSTIMATQAATMEKQREISEKTLPAMQAQASAAVSASAAAQSQAESSKQLAGETIRANERTWRVLQSTEKADVQEVQINCSAPMSRNTNVIPVFRNYGKSTATDLRIIWFLGDRRLPNIPIPQHISVATLGPEGIQSASALSVGDFIHDDATFQTVVRGYLKIQAWGTMDYRDAFGGHHGEFQATWIPNTSCDFVVDEMK